jgi:hypothetical protein
MRKKSSVSEIAGAVAFLGSVRVAEELGVHSGNLLQMMRRRIHARDTHLKAAKGVKRSSST